MTRFSAAMMYRKPPETPVADHAGHVVQRRAALLTGRPSARTPTANRNVSTNTTVECPSEKKNPTPSGRLRSAMSLRVVLSIAEMWSASKAWRKPSV